MKRLLCVLMTLICMIAIAGCGGEKAAAPASEGKVLKVATDPTFPPFELYLDKERQFTGFDIDLMNDLAKRMGYDRVEYIRVPFKEMLPGLDENRYDAVIRSQSITPERTAKYGVSDSYAKAGFAITAPADYAGTGAPGDFNGKKIAIEARSSAMRIAQLYPQAKIVEYVDNEAVLKAVKAKEVDFGICGNLTANYIISHRANPGVKIIAQSEKQDDLGIYTNKNNTELLKKINAALADYKRSGEYHKLMEFYFGNIEKH